MIRQALLAALACTSLAACATPAPTLYAPANGPQGIGFSEYRIEPGRYRITFRGGPGAPPAQVADFALLRAADLALGDGYDWFRISQRNWQDTQQDRGSRVSLGLGGSSYGGHTGVGLGLSKSFDLGGGPSLAQTLEVVMGKGPPPENADVYMAREVRRNLAPRI